MTELTRVVIADDHPIFREGLRISLSTAPDLQVVGEAATGEDAVVATLELQPDVVLMDLQMPTRGGVEATEQIVQTSPQVAVLVLTMFDDDDSVFAAMRAGARGYLLKGATRGEVLGAVHAVAGGELIFGPGVAHRVSAYFAARPAGPGKVFPQLTDREREVLDLIASGISNTDITKRLVVSPKTVRNHISNIFVKLQVANRAQAIVRAREAGLGIAHRTPDLSIAGPRTGPPRLSPTRR